MERVEISELVSDFLASLRQWISSGDVDLSAGLSLSKKNLDSLGVPLALLLEHGVIKECGPTTYKLPTPLVSHLRAACAVFNSAERPKADALDLAELCKRLQSGRAALEPSTLIKGVAPTQRRQLRRLHPVPAARAIAPTLAGYDGDLPLLHDWSAAAVGLEGQRRVVISGTIFHHASPASMTGLVLSEATAPTTYSSRQTPPRSRTAALWCLEGRATAA